MKSLISTLAASILLATPLAAQDLTAPLPEPSVASPFAFVESGGKSERAAAADTSDSGARVIGGQLADEGEWPWQVALLINGRPVGPNAQFCGGTMVLDRWVLTAAHCIHMQDQNGTYRDLDPRAISVLVGSNDIAPGKGDVVPVEKIFRYPDYVGSEYNHDIALMKLARTPQARYQTINVPTAEFGDRLDQPGVRTIVTGWGLTEGGKDTALMREVEIQMMSRDMCNRMMLESRAKVAAQALSQAAQVFGLKPDEAQKVWEQLVQYVRAPMSENMLCSGTFEGGKSSCNGDSGGPLVVPLQAGGYIQAGIVSWGMSNSAGTCAEDAPFAAYTRVSNYVGWLNQIINAN